MNEAEQKGCTLKSSMQKSVESKHDITQDIFKSRGVTSVTVPKFVLYSNAIRQPVSRPQKMDRSGQMGSKIQ